MNVSLYQESKITTKKVGAVRILEFFGNFSGSFLKRGETAIEKILNCGEDSNLLFNFRWLREIENEGIDFIYDYAKKMNKTAFLTWDSDIAKQFNKRFQSQKFMVSDNEMKLTDFFEKEFAVYSPDHVISHEQRKYPRLKTVLPLQFFCPAQGDLRGEFFAVITNLSAGGFFAEFIQSTDEGDLKKAVNPYDLRMIQLRFSLKEDGVVDAKGKLIHGCIEEGGIGIEFYALDSRSQNQLENWLAKQVAPRYGSELKGA